MSAELKLRRPDRIAFGSYLALLLWLPLPQASHSQWAMMLAGIMVCALLAWWSVLLIAGRVAWPKRLPRLVVPLVLWALWLSWIALQLIPLPASMLGWLSPAALAMHAPVAELAGLTPLNSISIAPADTWERLRESCIYFGMYLLTVLFVRGDSRLRLLLLVLLISGVFQAAYAIGMTMSGLEYGFFVAKTHYLGSATGTFVNRNHLAGYLEMTAAAGLGLVLADLRDTGPWSWRSMLNGLLNMMLSTRLRVRVGLAVIAVGLVLTRSRMGNLAFFGSLSVCGLAYISAFERRHFLKALFLFSSVLLVDVLIVNQWFGLERVIERIQATRLESESRTQLLKEVGPVVAEYRLTGAGLGAFAYAYEPHRTRSMQVYMDHAHNDYIEFLVDVGIVGCAILGLLVAAHLWHALRVMLRRRHRLKVGACFALVMGSVALAIHATAEFNFQIPANAATYVVLLAMAATCSSRPGRRRPSGGERSAAAGQAASTMAA